MSDCAKPAYWGNNIYESVMGLYFTEEEAKKESWRQEHFFPLYDKNQVKELQANLAQRDEAIKVMREALNNLSLYVSYNGDTWVMEKARKVLSEAEQILGGEW